MRVVFAGTPDAAVPSLRALVADPAIDVVGVITRHDAPLGRRRVLTPSPVAREAAEQGLAVHKANTLGGEEAAWLRDRAPDLGVIVAYGGLVPTEHLTIPARGWINLHFSHLPKWRGAAPVQRALMAGEERLGVTVFELVTALDAGAVLTSDSRDFPAGTTAGEALADLAEFGTAALMRAVTGLRDDSLVATPQSGEATYAHKLERRDGALDLRGTWRSVFAHWAGVTPEPGAYVMNDGSPLKLLDVRAADAAETPLTAGTAKLAGGRPILHLSDGALELVRVQPAGKGAMNAADWLRGRGGSTVLTSPEEGVSQ